MPFNFLRHGDRARAFRLACLQLAVALPITAITSTLARPTDPSQSSHAGPGVSNHPMNVVPSAAVSIPKGWPLDLDRSITCTTCHYTAPSTDGKGGTHLRGMNDSRSDPREFCMKCHRNSDGGSAATAHWMAASRAHILRASILDDPKSGSAIDRASRICLSCHDGVTASDAGHETGLNRGSGYLGDGDRNHPIGVPYPLSGTRHVDVPLRPAAALPETVRLPGGVVSCVSCHDLYQPDKNRLSVPIEESRLCLTCHDMN